MAKQTNENLYTTILPESGIKVILDKSKCNGQALINARMAGQGNPDKVVFFLIAACSTFDGETKIAEEILEMSAFDLMELEEFWAKTSKKYQRLTV